MRTTATFFTLLAGGACFAAMAIARTPTPRPATGERAFQRCYSCHSLDATETGLSGPNLDRLIGKPIAADRDFAYSPAFRAFARREKVWTRPLLDQFIADPEKLVPHNSMSYFGMKDAEQRRALVAYIAADR